MGTVTARHCGEINEAQQNRNCGKMTIKGMVRKLDGFDPNAAAVAAMQKSTGALEEKNRERMLDGQRSDGSTMPIYSYISQTVYGYPNTPIKLKATGEFQAAITITVNGDVVNTGSTDEKADMLVERYGAIFGTYGDYKAEYIANDLRPAFMGEVKGKTGLGK